LLSRLESFVDKAAEHIYHDTRSWVESEHSGDWDVVAAAAEGGDAKALIAMASAVHLSVEERTSWVAKLREQGDNLYGALAVVRGSFMKGDGTSSLEHYKDDVMRQSFKKHRSEKNSFHKCD
jgi:hypothetical protein